MAEHKKWKRFEDLAAHIQRTLAPGARVEQNVRITGQSSAVERQIDIAVWTTVGQYELFVAIDCKDHNVKLDVKDVEAFIGLVKDVRANKGAMVAALGFTAAAKNVAERAGVNLYTLVDAESEEWRTLVSIPVVVDSRSIGTVSYAVASTQLRRLEIMDPSEYSVFREDGTRVGRLRDLLSRLWNDRRIPYEPGEYPDVHLGDGPTFFRDGDSLARVELSANVRVVRTLHFGHLPLAKIQGFRDDMNGSILTTSFTTGQLDIQEVERTWQKLETQEALAVTPLMRLGFAVHYPLEGEEDDATAAEISPEE